MTKIAGAYINALLADAAYVNLLNEPLNSSGNQDLLGKLMTRTLAAYIAANFEVTSSINTSDIPLVGSGFDATVWRIKSGSELAGSNNENAGKTYVSMRGTELPPDAAGGDVVDGGTDNDLIFVDSQTDIARAIAQGNAQTGNRAARRSENSASNETAFRRVA